LKPSSDPSGPYAGKYSVYDAAVYIAQGPKSTAIYMASEAARRDVRDGDDPGVPLHLRNASTSLMKEVGYGAGYQYAHDFDAQTAPIDCLPESLAGKRYYEPKDSGLERQIRERLDALRQAREEIRKKR